MAGISVDIQTPRIFIPLLEPARYKGAYGGRASAKSHFFAGLAVDVAVSRPGSRGVCIREVQRSLKESAKLLIEDKIGAFGVSKIFECQTDQIKTPGGGIIIFRGMQDYNAESIKSLEGFDWAWVEEAQTLTSRSLELLRPTIRRPGSELWFSWNPRRASDPVDAFFRKGDPPPSSVQIRCSWRDNGLFPAEMAEEREFDKKHNPLRYAHIWEGEYEPAVVGAIWTMDMFTDWRIEDAPTDLSRILVSIDPAVSSGPGADEHGIMVGGAGSDQRGYLLEDATTSGPPEKWARRAVAMFDKWDADAIVVERNQGGDMVKNTLKTIRPGLPVVEVTATRGKHIRAEPIAAMYAMGKVSHVGSFPELESQYCQFTAAGYEGDGSPDRADAAVWLWTELFPRIVRRDKLQGQAQANTDWKVF